MFSRTVRTAALVGALGLALVSCAQQKDTGLPPSPTPEPVKADVVKVVDSAFDPKEFKTKPGESVTWSFVGSAPHNVRFVTLKDDKGKPVVSHPNCVPAGTGCASAGEKFTFTFTKAGSFLYYCVVHGTPAGGGMSGTIDVA